MHPIIVKLYFEPVISIHRMIPVLLFDLFQHGRNIDPLPQLDLILGDKIIRIFFTQRLYSAFMIRQGT